MLSYHMLRIMSVGLTIQYERIPGMITKTILVEKDMDMDIIPYLVQSACHYDCSLRISEGNKEINMKSIMGMTVLNLKKGTSFELTADGADEIRAVNEISGCFEE